MEKNERTELITQILLKVSDKINGDDLVYLRDQLSSVLYNYSVKEITQTELASKNNGEMTKELLKYFRIGKLSSGRTSASIEQYERAALQLCRFVNKELNLITDDDIKYFLVEYPNKNPEGKRVMGSTMDNKRRSLSSVFSYLYKNKKIAENPMDNIERIKYKKSIKKPLTEAEIEEIKIACEKYGRNRKRNYAMILFILDTGVRVSELSGIRLSDVDFDQLTVKVLGKENKERFVYFTEGTKIRIREYMKTRKDMDIFNTQISNINQIPLFASSKGTSVPMTVRSIQNVVKTIGSYVGIKIHPHLLRATGATSWHKRGMPIDVCADLLGHANLNSVMIYVKNSPDQIKAEYAKISN